MPKNEQREKIEKIMNELNNIPIKDLKKFFKTQDMQDLHQLKIELDDLYYNEGKTPIEDVKYDALKDFLMKNDTGYVPPVGAKLRDGENRAPLPFWLGSADKISPDDTDILARWMRKNKTSKYVVSHKLDGVSCLLVVRNGKLKLYTRGDGTVGADISYLRKYLKGIPKHIPQDIAVRGELIMKKSDFEPFRRKGEKKIIMGEKDYKHARGMVAGLVGAKTGRAGLDKIHFVAYEIVSDSAVKPSSQFIQLKNLGFEVVKYAIIKNITVPILEELFQQTKASSEYEVDGIIVQSDVDYDRNVSGNPEYMFAFKMLLEDTVKETTVIEVEWNLSKWGQFKPVVIIEPVELADITIKRVTAYNAKYVEENKLGPGAIIKVTRSKEVIPYIVEVVKGAKKAQMPNREYLWDGTHTNIITVESDNIVCIKLIANFFDKLGIKFVSEATVKKMYENGLDTVIKIVSASKERLLEIDEFQEKSAQRIYTNIRKGLSNVKISVLLGASGVFGFGIGRKRMDALFLEIPDLLERKNDAKTREDILNIEGFSDIMADRILENLQYGAKFAKLMSKYSTYKKEKRVSDDMKGQKYVMTGFRDAALEEQIAQRGGKMVSSVSKNTTAVIVAAKGNKPTGKLKKAEDLGVPIYTRDEFVKKFIH